MEPLQRFKAMYQAFLDTLLDIYPDVKELDAWRTSCYSTDTPGFLRIAEDFRRDLDGALVRSKDPKLFQLNPTSLARLQLPALWTQNRLSPKSKEYVWEYIQNLLNHAEAAAPRDIKPPGTLSLPSSSSSSTPSAPPGTPGPPDHLPAPSPDPLETMYSHIPASMLEKVKSVADRYSAQVENGETKLEDLQFQEISKELFNSIDPEEMQQVVQNIGSLLQMGP
jgi:hypothetical protein